MDFDEFKYYMDIKKVEKFQQKGVENYLEYAYKRYMSNVQPYLSLISTWKINDDEDSATLNEIRMALSLPKTLFELYRGIPEFAEALDLNKNIMSFKAQMDLMEAISFYKKNDKRNAKLLEMQLLRYDKEYKKKDKDEDGETLPSKINIEFSNGRK